MAEPVRVRRLTDQERQRLQQIVRRGKHGSVRVRRAMIIMASTSGTLVPTIAPLVTADEDTVRDVIHLFNAKGLAALDPQWAGGRPRLISDEDIQVIVTPATAWREKLGQPFTRWSLRKLAAYLAERDHLVRVGRERLRQILHARGISFQRTRIWKESGDPDRDAKLDRIEYVTSAYPDRCFAFDQFGLLSIRPCHGACRAKRKQPARLRATYHRTHGIRYFHGCYFLPWAMISCGAWSVSTRAPVTPWPRRSRSGPPGRASTGCSSSWTTCRRTRPRRSAAGPAGRTSNCA
jgi:transposase